MKKIDKLISTSFIGPSILSFFVATFVLVMQFLWKYIDEILGKGFTILEMLELIFYYAVTLIPLSVPITILISSVMVFGDMAEKYELSSMKSAGVSLLRIMLPSIFVAILIGLFSLLASNFLKPAANLQFQKRFTALRKQKSALAIEEGIFNNAFNETIIRVGEIDKDGRGIHDVLIYDHTPNDKSLIGVMSAKGGEMYTAEEGKYFIMKLDTGIQYRELEKRTSLGSNKSEQPFMRTYFDQWTKTFDMSQFDAEEGILNFNRNREDMMNTFQLLKSIDTFQRHINENNEKINSRVTELFISKYSENTKKVVPNKFDSLNAALSKNTRASQGKMIWKADTSTTTALKKPIKPDTLHTKKNPIVQSTKGIVGRINRKVPLIKKPIKVTDTMNLSAPIFPKKVVKQKTDINLDTINHFVATIDASFYKEVIVSASTNLSRDRDEMMSIKNITYDYKKSSEKYKLRLNQQYSWAAICIIFLFIGAPLGSIIRKGGYGYPLLVAILFYMIFIINTILGEKLVKNESMGGVQAAWLPCITLMPFAFFLTLMALRDIRINPMALIDFIYRLRHKERN
ncbi:MAG: LptF/LptG family permease [Saprospiraceae bacterium]|nr:LptF/LptG family permease [Saprospiraceae bacterium]